MLLSSVHFSGEGSGYSLGRELKEGRTRVRRGYHQNPNTDNMVSLGHPLTGVLIWKQSNINIFDINLSIVGDDED